MAWTNLTGFTLMFGREVSISLRPCNRKVQVQARNLHFLLQDGNIFGGKTGLSNDSLEDKAIMTYLE